MAFITMNNISKTFHGVKALNNVTLELSYGEALCLAGQNGCSKSTLIKILSVFINLMMVLKFKLVKTNILNLHPNNQSAKGYKLFIKILPYS